MSEKTKSKFEELAAIDVSRKIEKKNGLSYLSWAWALDTLLRADPDASWEYGEPKIFAETMMVYCTVTAFSKQRTAHLPVMDHRNQPIKNPNAFQINTAMQRALVKAIALHGLGLYIYAGEDLPQSDDDGNAATKSAPTITPTAGAWEGMDSEQQKMILDLVDCIRSEMSARGAESAYVLLQSETADWSVEEKTACWTRFDSKERSAMKKTSQLKKAA